MPFTSLTIIKAHLLSSSFGPLTMEDHPVQLNGTDDVQLPHHHLVEGTERVKWEVTVTPEAEGPITLSGEDWANLSSGNLVPASLVVTLSRPLATLYAEGPDFQVDHLQGLVRRVPGTSIPDQQAVFVYYRCYSLFERSADYEIDAASGTLRRTDDGLIPDGATVRVDYLVTAGSVQDDFIVQAIAEAEDQILRALAPGYNEYSTDQGLQTGATELVLSILTRTLATEALARFTTSDAASRAREWQNLSRFHEAKAWTILRPFLTSFAAHSPEKISNVPN